MTVDEAENQIKKLDEAEKGIIKYKLLFFLFAIGGFCWPIVCIFMYVSGFSDVGDTVPLVLGLSIGATAYCAQKHDALGRLLSSRSSLEQQLEQSLIDFYLECEDFDVDVENGIDLLAFASTMTVNKDINVLKDRYNRGKLLSSEQDDRLATEREESARTEKLNAFKLASSDERSIARLKGKDKYLEPLRVRLKEAERDVESCRTIRQVYISSGGKPVQHDSYALAGMAEGIAGPAAAIVAFNQTEAENRQAREDYQRECEKARARSNDFTSGLLASHLSGLQHDAFIIKKAIERIDGKMLVEDGSAGLNLFSKIAFDGWDFDIDKTGPDGCSYLTLKVVAQSTEDMRLLGWEARIDGSIRVTLSDGKTNETLGEVCLNAPGYGAEDLSGVGFSREGTMLTGHCIVAQDVEEIKHFEEPIHLWVIEI